MGKAHTKIPIGESSPTNWYYICNELLSGMRQTWA